LSSSKPIPKASIREQRSVSAAPHGHYRHALTPHPSPLTPRAQDNIGQALLQNDGGKLAFLECDSFAVHPETKSLVWTSSLPADAVLLAGVLKTNTTLTALGVAAGNKLSDSGRAAIGRALLQNKEGRVGFCDELGLKEGVKVTEIDLANSFHSVEAFLLLAGVLRANRTLTSLTMSSLKTEHIEPLAEGLRSNSTLEILRLQSNVRRREPNPRPTHMAHKASPRPQPAHLTPPEPPPGLADGGTRLRVTARILMLVCCLIE